MMRHATVFFSVLALVLAVSCTPESKKEPAGSPDGAGGGAGVAAAAAEITEPTKHHAKCGCAIESVGHCGNYVEMGGEYVELEWPELGKMEYCAQKEAGADIEITGAMKDGKFVATSYKRLQ